MAETDLLPTRPRSDNTFGWFKKMRKTDEFSSVFHFRCVRSVSGIDLLAAPNGLIYPRLGLIVPKKIIPSAVGRNRIKRLIREAFRLNQNELVGLDVVARIKYKLDETKLVDALPMGLQQCKTCLVKRAKPILQAANADSP